MSNEAVNKANCADCGYVFDSPEKIGAQTPEKRKPCPSCGSKSISFGIHLESTLTVLESLNLKHKDKGGFILGTSTIRAKVSGATKKRANEVLSYDRSNPRFTKKTHHVEEIDSKGKPEVVHHEEEFFESKRRPKRN